MRQLLLCLAFVLFAPAAFAQQVGNHTYMTYEPQHGTQVEYLSRQGEAFLWYPGNSVILAGRWKREGSSICFAYDGNTYNPVTGHIGGSFECMPFALHQSGIRERVAGDLLNLERRVDAPFRLSKSQTTLEALRAKIGQ